MIPPQICEQYISFCKETGFKTFSKRTTLRILTACKASVRKSLQGLDYFAAKGAKAFDDLMVVVDKVTDVGARQEWKRETCDALKAEKLYLKADYKVRM